MVASGPPLSPRPGDPPDCCALESRTVGPLHCTAGLYSLVAQCVDFHLTRPPDLPLCESLPSLGESRVQCGLHHTPLLSAVTQSWASQLGAPRFEQTVPMSLKPMAPPPHLCNIPNQTTMSSVGMPAPEGLSVPHGDLTVSSPSLGVCGALHEALRGGP